jgi:multiple sugar transport system ATP-binding protein
LPKPRASRRCAVTFGLRPEHVTVGAADDAHAVRVRAEVMLVEPLGSDTLGLVRLGNGRDAGEITGRFSPEAGLEVGRQLTVSLALNRFHLFDASSGSAIRGTDW